MKDRIRRRRKELGFTQAELAKRVGSSRVSVTDWEAGKVKPSGEHLSNLLIALNCDIKWLFDGGEMAPQGNASGPIKTYDIPLISSVAAGAWTEGVREKPETYITVTERFPDGTFALRVNGDSMHDPDGPISIPDGSIVMVVPDYDPVSGKIVVAMLEGSEEATVKRLVIDGPIKYLMPLNKRYQPIPVNGNCRIVGRVKQVINIQNL